MIFREFIEENGKTLSLKKGQHVFMQGESNQYFYYVTSGLLKAYYSSENGQETIKSFIFPQDMICSLTAIYSDGLCSFNLLCLEDCTFLKVPFSLIQKVSLEDHEFAINMINLLIQFSMKKEKREYEFLNLSAEKRYKALIENSPNLLKIVTQNDIAGYLGITPVGLSRIKKRVMEEGMRETGHVI